MGNDDIDSEEAMATSVVSERLLHRMVLLVMALVFVVVFVVVVETGFEKETVLEKGGCEVEGERRRRRKKRHGMRKKKSVCGMNKVEEEGIEKNKSRCQ